MLSPLEKIFKAKIELRTNPMTRFFSYLVSQFHIIEDSSCPTAGVSADKEIVYSPEFVAKLSSSQVVFLLAHEVLHYALQHVFRIPKGDKKKANIAMDLKVNDILITEGIGTKIEGGYLPYNHSYYFEKQRYKLVDIHLKSVEQIYEEIPDDPDDAGSGQGSMDIHTCKNANTQDLREHHRDMAGAVNAQERGFKSGDLTRLFKDIHDPIVPWRDVLARFVQPFINDSYSWSKLNRKVLAQKLLLPGYIKSEKIQGIISADTSGSISDKDLTDVISEVSGLINSFNSLEIKLLIGDAELKEEHDLTKNFELSDIKFKGGGGTSHGFVFDYIQENNPQFAIIFSDMQSDIEYCFNKYDTGSTSFLFIGTKGSKDMSEYGLMAWIE